MAVLVAAMGASHRAAADEFSTTNVQFLYGWAFHDRKFGSNTTTGRMATLTLNHFSTWSYGDNFFFVDLSRGDFTPGLPQQAHVFAEWRPRVFLNKLFKAEGDVLGIFSDVGFAGDVSQSGNAFYAYLAGVGVNFALPARYSVALNLYYRYDRYNGNEWQVSPFWRIVFRIADVRIVAAGFIDIYGTKDAAGHQDFDFLAQPELLVDVLALFGGPVETLFFGTEWFLHRYPDGPYGPGRFISAPQVMVQWTFQLATPRPAESAPLASTRAQATDFLPSWSVR